MTDLIKSEIDRFLAEKAQETAPRGDVDAYGRLAKSGRVARSSKPFRLPAARSRTPRQSGRCRCRTVGGEPAHFVFHLRQHTICYPLVLTGLREPAIRSEAHILLDYEWTNAQS